MCGFRFGQAGQAETLQLSSPGIRIPVEKMRELVDILDHPVGLLEQHYRRVAAAQRLEAASKRMPAEVSWAVRVHRLLRCFEFNAVFSSNGIAFSGHLSIDGLDVGVCVLMIVFVHALNQCGHFRNRMRQPIHCHPVVSSSFGWCFCFIHF